MNSSNIEALHKLLDVVEQAIDTNQIPQAQDLVAAGLLRWDQNEELLAVKVKVSLIAKDIAEALNAARELSLVNPKHPIAVIQLGILELQNGNIEQAIICLEKAVENHPKDRNLYKWLGHAYHEAGLLEKAIIAYEKNQEDDAQAEQVRLPLAFAYRNVKNIETSNHLLNEELRVKPDNVVAKFSLAQNQLMQGNLSDGLIGYECRWENREAELYSLPCERWKYGMDLKGKSILVFDEQGFGDCILFARFLPALVKVASKVELRLRPKLHNLLSDLTEGCELVDDVADAKTEIAIPMMSLPLALGLDRNEIETEFAHSYLIANPSLKSIWAKRIEELKPSSEISALKVGLIWQGDPNSPAEQGRSLSFEDIQPLLEQTDCLFYIMQMGGEDRFEGGDLPSNVIDLGGELDRDGHAFVDTAAAMMCMDVVISSDTATAHLAGALGCESWIMLKYVPEWRWELEGVSSYWYRTARLFRQPLRGDWAGVLSDVKLALKEQKK